MHFINFFSLQNAFNRGGGNGGGGNRGNFGNDFNGGGGGGGDSVEVSGTLNKLNLILQFVVDRFCKLK